MSGANTYRLKKRREDEERAVAILKAECAALDALMDCWSHALDPMPTFTPAMHDACAALAKLRSGK